MNELGACWQLLFLLCQNTSNHNTGPSALSEYPPADSCSWTRNRLIWTPERLADSINRA